VSLGRPGTLKRRLVERSRAHVEKMVTETIFEICERPKHYLWIVL
jgi:hypothetical protein